MCRIVIEFDDHGIGGQSYCEGFGDDVVAPKDVVYARHHGEDIDRCVGCSRKVSRVSDLEPAPATIARPRYLGVALDCDEGRDVLLQELACLLQVLGWGVDSAVTC